MMNKFGFLDGRDVFVIDDFGRGVAMQIRRVIALLIAFALLSPASLSLLAQQVEKKEEKRSKQEQQDIEALVKTVDAVSSGQQQPPRDLSITWESSNYVKGQDGKTYVPFTVVVDPSKLSSPSIAMYVRVVSKGGAPATATATAGDKKDDNKKKDKPEYPWDNVHFVDVKDDGRVSRAMAIPGGDYDVFIAVKEKSTGQKNQPQKMAVLRQDLKVPDFNKPGLTTSSIIVADTVEPVQTALTNEQQQENPYTFGKMRVVPSLKREFKKAGELQVLFWIYGASADANKKPDVQVEYSFHQKASDGEKYFNKTAPQQLNAQTLPPEFDMAAGHQLPGSLVVPLNSFPPGEYRLEIKVTDKPSGQTLTENVNFTVVA
jgi:hypothetical protein